MAAARIIADAKTRWLTKVEINYLLTQGGDNVLPYSKTPTNRPASGSVFMFLKDGVSRKSVFRADGVDWRRKKDCMRVREDHEVLKINGVPRIKCAYARASDSEIRSLVNGTSACDTVNVLHRRIYTLADVADGASSESCRRALVHYLSIPTTISALGSLGAQIASSQNRPGWAQLLEERQRSNAIDTLDHRQASMMSLPMVAARCDGLALLPQPPTFDTSAADHIDHDDLAAMLGFSEGSSDVDVDMPFWSLPAPASANISQTVSIAGQHERPAHLSTHAALLDGSTFQSVGTRAVATVHERERQCEHERLPADGKHSGLMQGQWHGAMFASLEARIATLEQQNALLVAQQFDGQAIAVNHVANIMDATAITTDHQVGNISQAKQSVSSLESNVVPEPTHMPLPSAMVASASTGETFDATSNIGIDVHSINENAQENVNTDIDENVNAIDVINSTLTFDVGMYDSPPSAALSFCDSGHVSQSPDPHETWATMLSSEPSSSMIHHGQSRESRNRKGHDQGCFGMPMPTSTCALNTFDEPLDIDFTSINNNYNNDLFEGIDSDRMSDGDGAGAARLRGDGDLPLWVSQDSDGDDCDGWRSNNR